MKLLLIRHGDPYYPTDSLTELGRREADLLAQSLDDTQLDELFVSTMGRAQLTAQYVLERRPVPSINADWLRELDAEYATGRWAYDLRGPGLLNRAEPFSSQDWASEVVYGPHVLEMLQSFYASFESFMQSQGYEREGLRYRVSAPSERIIAFVCHGGVISSLVAYMFQIPVPVVYGQFTFLPTSVTTVQMREQNGLASFELLHLNDTSHLRSLREQPSGKPLRA